MALCEPRVSCINIKKISKIKNISQFGLEKTLERERGGRKKQASSAILGFAGRKSIGRELKLFYATRTTRGYRNHKISPRSKVLVFTKTEKRLCLGKSRYSRWGFSPPRFNFCLRACVCMFKGGAIQFSPSTP